MLESKIEILTEKSAVPPTFSLRDITTVKSECGDLSRIEIDDIDIRKSVNSTRLDAASVAEQLIKK